MSSAWKAASHHHFVQRLLLIREDECSTLYLVFPRFAHIRAYPDWVCALFLFQ